MLFFLFSLRTMDSQLPLCTGIGKAKHCQKNGARIKAAHSVTKDDIIEKVSAIVGVR